jgi:hypothetical protein
MGRFSLERTVKAPKDWTSDDVEFMFASESSIEITPGLLSAFRIARRMELYEAKLIGSPRF